MRKAGSVNLCQVLSWIAFRNDRFITSDPHKLRRDMRRYRKHLIEPNPAADFLKAVRAGELTARAQSTRGDMKLVQPHDWMEISEADLWEIVEQEWARIKEVQ